MDSHHARPHYRITGASFAWFTPSIAILLAGYLFFDKPFANIPIPGTPAFIGEAVLVVGLLEFFRPPSAERQLLESSPQLRIAGLLFVYSAARTMLGVPTYGVDALRDFAMIYYILFSFIVAAAALTVPTFTTRLLTAYDRVLPLFLAWAPVAVLLSDVAFLYDVYVPGTNVPINSFKTGDFSVSIAMSVGFLWLGCDRLTQRSSTTTSGARVVWLSILGLIGLVICGTQNRGGFIAGAATLLTVIWYLPSGRRRHLALSLTSAMMIVVAVTLLLDLRLPGRDREVSLQRFVVNMSSIVVRENDDLQGTVQWREDLWSNVTSDMLRSGTWPIGLGFGPILGEIYGAHGVGGFDRPLRNVHNSHLTLFARIGLAGFALWVLLWATWLRRMHMWIRRRGGVRNANASICAWLAATATGHLVNAYFDPSIEGPQVAVLLYVILGIGIAITHGALERSAHVRTSTSRRPPRISWPRMS